MSLGVDARGYPLHARLRDLWHSQGAAGVWFTALALSVYRRMLLLERPLDEPIPEYVPRVAAEIRPLTAADEIDYGKLQPHDARRFLTRMELGHQCWGAWCEDGLRHVCWVAFREAWIDYLARPLPLAQGEVYSYGLFTHPGWRGLGLSPARTTRYMSALRAQGYRRVLTAVLPENRMAQSPLLKAGYGRIGVIGCVGLWGWRRHFYWPDPGRAPRRGL